MRKIRKKVFSVILVAALTVSAVPYSEYAGFQTEVQAATNLTKFDENYSVDSNVIPDINLLMALKEIIGGSQYATITFSQLKSYTGKIDLTAYPQIADVTGLGYAVKASSIDLSGLTRVKKIYDNEFQLGEFSEFKLPPNITEIGKEAFFNCVNLKTIQFPESLTKIFGQAFKNCTSLNHITLPEGIVKIGDDAFANCASLTSIVIPDGINATVENSGDDSVNGIGANVFAECKSLSKVTIGAGMTAIPAGFFRGTESLISITIPEKVISIRNSAFAGSGLKSIDLSKNIGLTAISTSVFENCIDLASVQLPESIETIDTYAFSNCSSLKNTDFLLGLDNLVKIGNYAFSNTGLQSVKLPGNVEIIDAYAFQKCNELQTVVLNDFTREITTDLEKRIGEHAFEKCNFLNTVVLPVENQSNIHVKIVIDKYAFAECGHLETINFPTNLSEIGDYAFTKCAKSVSDWANTTDEFPGIYKGRSYYIHPDYIQDVPGSNMERAMICSNEMEAYYQPTVAYINRMMLHTSRQDGEIQILVEDATSNTNMHTQNRTGLKYIDLSKNKNIKLGIGVFSYCTNLERASLPSTLTEIPNYTFQGCAAPKLLGSSGAAVSSLGAKAEDAEWYYGLRTVNMSDNVTKIGTGAFENCYRLDLEGKLPGKLEDIGASAFLNCQSIGKIALPKTLKTIRSNAFKGCSRIINNAVKAGIGLTSVDASGASNLQQIGTSAFENCSLDLFIMNDDAPITKIEGAAFRNCQYMNTIKVSKHVAYIDANVLSNCVRLMSVSIPDICTLNKNVCYGSVNLTDAPSSFYYYEDTNGKKYYVTYKFVLSVIPVDSHFSVRENASATLPLYTIPNDSASLFKDIKIDNNRYDWNSETKSFDGDQVNTCLFPSELPTTNTIGKTDYYNSMNQKVRAVSLEGLKEGQNISVIVQEQIILQIAGDKFFEVDPAIQYFIDVTKNPCTEIQVDESYYVDYHANKTVKIEPKFIAQYDDSEITDAVEWTIEAGNDIISLTPSADGKTATAKAINLAQGSARVKVKAGAIEKSFYIYSSAPANGVKLSATKMDLMFGSTGELTATMSYANADINSGASQNYPDNIIFTSSDEKIVRVESVSREDGSTTCVLVPVSAGSAVITAKAQAANRTATCTVNVSSANIKVTLTDADGNAVNNGASIYSIGNAGTTLKYAMNEELSLNNVSYVIDDESVATVSVNTGRKEVKITGKKKGKTRIVIYPSVGTAQNNGVVLNVTINANVNYINLSKKSVQLGTSDSVFVMMRNTFGTELSVPAGTKYLSVIAYAQITDNDIVFESSDPACVSVDKYGVVTVKKLTADMKPVTITCTAYRDGIAIKSASTTVTPVKPYVKGISYTGNTTVYVGKTNSIKLAMTPSNAEYRSINVSVSNGFNSVLSYEWNANTKTIKVKGIKPGTVTFTVNVFNNDGSKCVKNIKVTVKNETLKAPGKVKILKPKAAKKKVTVLWKKTSGASGYQVQMSTKKASGYKTIATIKSGSKVKYIKKKLKSKKYYYFRVRAFAKSSSGQVKYGSWSAVKKVKVK